MWFIRKWFWIVLAWVKFAGVKPENIPLPPATGERIKPVPLSAAIPGLPIDSILTCHPRQIPADEKSLVHSLSYKLQVWLYSAFSPMQPGLPPIDPDPVRALRRAYTWLHRSKFAPPVLPAEFYGSPDLGSLAVRGPYAGYLRKHDDHFYAWDLSELGSYEHHAGLDRLGVKVLFKVDPVARALQAVRIETSRGSASPGDPDWERAKKVALCAVSTHTSLVRHFNWLHLAGGAHLAIATRNRLPPKHPLCRLLWPYMYATQQNGDIVTRGQMLPGGDFETAFSFSFAGMCRLFEDTYREFRIVTNDPEDDAEARQIRNAGFDTPTQRNLEALFHVIHEHARNYLRIYYPEIQPGSSTAAIRSDAPILAWLDELNRLIPNGVEVTRAEVTFDSLARLLARFMYMVTVQHELLGGFLWNYQLWSHRQPVRVYKNGQREPLDVYQRLVNANYNLNVHRRELIFDFSYLALDAAGERAFVNFVEALKTLQEEMEREPHAVWKLYPQALKVNINA